MSSAHESESRIHELEQRNAELQTRLDGANRELESLMYVVSHDLRAPLRSIAGYCQILQEDAGPSLDEQHRQFLTRMQLATQKLGKQIDGLLELSRLARADIQPRALDVSELAHEVADRLQTLRPEAVFEIAPGIKAVGDVRLVTAMLEQLLGNALKFTARQATPRIEISATTNNDRCIVRIRDNGVGFDMRYAEKLFSPFQRMHGENDFPGLGMGLALVQRMQSRQSGRVWAEAEPGNGATFYFDLPVA